MAAAVEASTPRLRDLAGVRIEEMHALLEDEVAAWEQALDWDFRPSAELTKRFLESGALTGYALEAEGQVVGYSYYVAEDPKSLIGDLFLTHQHKTAENERLLLGAAVGASMRTRAVKRIEAQVMLLECARQGPVPGERYLTSFPRLLMRAHLGRVRELRVRPVEDKVLFDRWTERRQEEAAHLIAAAYRGHVDSLVNDQYRTPAGARRFLHNILQYPGCGTFFPPACWVAVERKTARLCGVSLASRVRTEVGHVTQICVSPAMRGQGVGYELLRRSMESLALAGATRVSLSVTAANEKAVRMYERMGFGTLREFLGLVWEGF
ncbi:MAG: GNAT family N-acetyltransferase [Acidobacteria bacterium]|nr:GNAT family N-acetyltransferase [Acidobacteriota bacterium]